MDFSASHPFSLDAATLATLRRIGFSSFFHQAIGTLDPPPVAIARICARHRSGCEIDDGHRREHVTLAPGALQRLQATHGDAVTGDWCTLRVDRHGGRWIDTLLPRRNLIARGRGAAQSQPLVANIDAALVLMGLDGNYNPRRLERYLLLARGADVSPVVVLSKADACADADVRRREIESLAGASVPVLCGDMRDTALRKELAPWLQPQQTLVLLGSSGVGKSTLTNTLLGTRQQLTGDVSDAADRGRHTTVARRLLALPDGACLIDTPGLRELQLSGAEALGEGAFEDIAALAVNCRYTDCRHEQEPGCAVAGVIDAERLAHFRKLGRELAHAQQTTLQQRERRQQDKAQSRALRRFYRDGD